MNHPLPIPDHLKTRAGRIAENQRREAIAQARQSKGVNLAVTAKFSARPPIVRPDRIPILPWPPPLISPPLISPADATRARTASCSRKQDCTGPRHGGRAALCRAGLDPGTAACRARRRRFSAPATGTAAANPGPRLHPLRRGPLRLKHGLWHRFRHDRHRRRGVVKLPDLATWLTTARHESAHIVACLELGVTFDDVRVRELQNQVVGEINNPTGDPVRTAIAALAGIAGEALDSGADIGELIESGAVDVDLRAARAALARIGQGTPDDLGELLPFALDIVAKHAALVERIAPVLCLVKRITYRQCLGLAGRA
jgi:hypothetical protein